MTSSRLLTAYQPAGDCPFPPEWWFVPARLSHTAVVGTGPDTTILLTGWEVWPDSLGIRLSVFRRQAHEDRGDGTDGLRFTMVLADGRRAGTSDPDVGGVPGQAEQPSLRLRGGSGGLFHYGIELYMSQLPPQGPLTLVTEWPAAKIPETRTEFDGTALRAAAETAVEVWPGLPPAPEQEVVGWMTMGPQEIMARPQQWLLPRPQRRPPVERDRADWEGMGAEGWADPEVVRARLAAGADPDDLQGRPLHRAAAVGAPEAVRELAGVVSDVDQVDDEGVTALWEAVCHGAEENAAVLLAAGADAWTPRVARWSPGRLALTTRLAPLFAGSAPPGARLTDAELAAFRAADAQAEVFGEEVHTEGISVAFVSGVDATEALRRLGADPYRAGSEEYDPYDDWGDCSRVVGVTAVPGGCVLVQPCFHGLNTDAWLAALTNGGGRAYGVYFNPKGGTFGTLAMNGRAVHSEEIGLPPGEEHPEGHWTHRFWAWDSTDRLWEASKLAYACDQAGLSVDESRAVTGHPDWWAEIREDSALSAD
ncbi:ankyrin repeat domain-containing protein [Streptomyces syringium]|uniref:ankyrin repeat domain-containing protein n=1 Tax=Streptomyces syringium TaxID=76729 RepID=UPI0033D5718B